MNKNFFLKKKLIIIVSIILSTFFLIISLKKALIFSHDFQRSGAKALTMGIEPFAEYLNGNINEIFIKNQAPNYLQTLYFIFIPFALIPNNIANFLWAISNILMLISSTFLLSRIYSINENYKIIFLFLVLISGVPARNTITNGQLSIFVLHSILLGIFISLKNRNNKSHYPGLLISGFSYLKYSFAPAFAIFNSIFFGFKGFVITCLPAISGVVLMSLLFRTSTSIIGPLQVSSKSVANGMGDLLSIFKLINIEKEELSILFIAILSILLSLFFVWIARNHSFHRFLPLTSLASLMFVNHLPYDYVFYFILLFFGFSAYATQKEKIFIYINWAFIGYGYWLFNKLNFEVNSAKFVTFYFTLNIALYFVIFLSEFKKDKEKPIKF
tara:strand:+ start:102 stop:1256 length:1155 start_codon:yes stop_codon:yes gene_type:complete